MTTNDKGNGMTKIESTVDFSKAKKNELKKVAQSMGLKGYSKLNVTKLRLLVTDQQEKLVAQANESGETAHYEAQHEADKKNPNTSAFVQAEDSEERKAIQEADAQSLDLGDEEEYLVDQAAVDARRDEMQAREDAAAERVVAVAETTEPKKARGRKLDPRCGSAKKAWVKWIQSVDAETAAQLAEAFQTLAQGDVGVALKVLKAHGLA